MNTSITIPHYTAVYFCLLRCSIISFSVSSPFSRVLEYTGKISNCTALDWFCCMRMARLSWINLAKQFQPMSRNTFLQLPRWVQFIFCHGNLLFSPLHHPLHSLLFFYLQVFTSFETSVRRGNYEDLDNGSNSKSFLDPMQITAPNVSRN